MYTSDNENKNGLRLSIKTARMFIDEKGFKDILIMRDLNFPGIKWTGGFIEDILTGENSIEYVFPI